MANPNLNQIREITRKYETKGEFRAENPALYQQLYGQSCLVRSNVKKFDTPENTKLGRGLGSVPIPEPASCSSTRNEDG